MKKILYYAPLIPAIGIFIHLLWPLFNYEICTAQEGGSTLYSLLYATFQAVSIIVVPALIAYYT